MKYVISNIKLVPNERERNLFVEQVERLVQKLKFIPKKYTDSEKLKINISNINSYEFRVSCSIKLGNSLVFLTESGKDFTTVSFLLFDKFRKKVAVQLEKNRVFYMKNRKRNQKSDLDHYMDSLDEFKQTKDETSFKSLVKILLPGLERYVNRMLHSAQMADLLSRNDIRSEDIIDEVIVRTFQTFEGNMDKAEDMNIWMMKETDAVMNEWVDQSKHDLHAASVEDIINSEMAGMEAKYAYDGSGDLVMLEELDEYDNPDTLLGIEEALLVSGSEKEMIDKISDNLSRKQMKDMIRNELIHLPLRYQSVYDLFFFEQTSIEDIAEIKNENPERIEEIIEEVKLYLKKRLNL